MDPKCLPRMKLEDTGTVISVPLSEPKRMPKKFLVPWLKHLLDTTLPADRRFCFVGEATRQKRAEAHARLQQASVVGPSSRAAGPSAPPPPVVAAPPSPIAAPEPGPSKPSAAGAASTSTSQHNGTFHGVPHGPSTRPGSPSSTAGVPPTTPLRTPKPSNVGIPDSHVILIPTSAKPEEASLTWVLQPPKRCDVSFWSIASASVRMLTLRTKVSADRDGFHLWSAPKSRDT